MRRSLVIARKELRGYFDLPAAYVLLAVFLGLSMFLFFRAVFLIQEASMRGYFDILPWILLFFVPAVTMRAMAAERREGTMEILLTAPVKEWEVLAGKFLGNLAFVAIALLLTLPALLGISLGGDVDWGVALAQYLGALMLSSVMVALGLLASSLTRNQSVAFILGLFITAALVISGIEFVLIGTPPPFDLFVRQMSLIPHFEPIARGVLDLRDVIYYVTMTALALVLSYLALVRGKVSRKDLSYRLLKLGVALLAAITLFVNLLGAYIGGRIDLTEDRLYTLSAGSKQILRALPDIVTITFYSSKEVPAQVAATQRDIRDMLTDYDREGGDDVRVRYKYPDTDLAAKEEAERAGVEPVQFNIVGNDEFQVKQGWLGIAVQYADQSDVIPLVDRTTDLEYRLSSAINRVSRPDKRRIRVLQGHGENSLYAGLSLFNRGLTAQYESEPLEFDKKDPVVPAGTEILIFPGGDKPVPAAELRAVERFLDGGGKALFLVERTKVETQAFIADPVPASWAPVLERYGVSVDAGMAYDLSSHDTVTFGGSGGQSFRLPYPLWVRAQTNRDHPIVGDLRSVLLAWPGSLRPTAKGSGQKARVLLETTEAGGRMTGELNLAPNDNPQLKQTGLGRRTLALSLEGIGDKGDGRMVVVGDVDFITDQFASQGPENLSFALSAVDWLAQEDTLAGIRAKQTAPRRLLFESRAMMEAVRYGSMIGVPVLVAIYGLFRLARRRARAKAGFSA